MAKKKLSDSVVKELAEEVKEWGSMKQTGVSLKQMMNFGGSSKNLLISAQFVHKELPIRIARRVIELENLPYGLSTQNAVLQVRDWYLDSFRDLRSYPEIKDKNDELKFTQMVKMIKVRHNNVVPMMALGVKQLKKERPQFDYKDLKEVHQFLDRFYLSRIGIRMLIGQHVALHDPNPLPNCVGYIHTKMSPLEVARDASEDARSMCLREYGSAPAVNIYGDPNLTFPYVPSHLHMMVFELVKNSARAVQERFMDSYDDAPPIRIIVAGGLEDVTIKISDEGGGIPRSGLPKIFTYLYSTAENPLDEDFTSTGAATACTMAGYGYGIPISRLYARYFGGDLQILSMEGYGTDAFLHLLRLGDSQEPLP
ncbi:pyruvate dehydrogenase (acetyl-transferring) kinase, mitochondrial-like [Solanum pennellii]|uniref:Protein-serine/threonine kinase n=1 Tax=Solanum pennellii TaxID=28526 RepID=A0ABM1FRQ0_SOLPN|nr:pyruvate dehydrogenase (acetyl-transferring) kinase, mitochondrial-like [Solanum pennellii]